jgi:hypothetical protein
MAAVIPTSGIVQAAAFIAPAAFILTILPIIPAFTIAPASIRASIPAIARRSCDRVGDMAAGIVPAMAGVRAAPSQLARPSAS